MYASNATVPVLCALFETAADLCIKEALLKSLSISKIQ